MMLSVDKITEILRLGFDVDKLKSSLCKPFISLRYHRKVSIDHAGCEWMGKSSWYRKLKVLDTENLSGSCFG